MAKKNAVVLRQQAAVEAAKELTARIYKQYLTDILCIILHKRGYSYDDINSIVTELDDVSDEYKIAINTKHVEADVARYKIDEALKKIVPEGQPVYSFKDRYPELDDIIYGK